MRRASWRYFGLRAAAGLAAAFALLFVMAAPAAAQAGGATASTDHIAPNADMTLSATGFAPNSKVDLFIDEGRYQTVNADGAGAATATFRSPPTAGTYRARLTGISPSSAPRSPFAVVTVLSVPCANTCNTLPRTGVDLRLVGLGLGAIAVGLVGIRFKRQVPTVAMVVLVAGIIAATVRTSPTYAQAAPGGISGKVTDETGGAPAPGICVHASAGADFGAAITDANGDYTITGLPPSDYKVAFADCNATATFYREYFDNAILYNQATVVTVTAGATAPGKDAALLRGGVGSGRVTDATSGDGLPFTCVRFGETTDSLTCLGLTSGSGAFVTEPIPAGAMYIAFHDLVGGHAIRYLGDKNDVPSSATRTITAGQETGSLDIALPAGATVSGTIVDNDTSGAPDRAICVFDISSDVPTLASAFANQDGTFELEQLGPGTHKVRFTDCDGAGTEYVEQFFAQKADVSSADPVALTAAQDRAGVDARLSKSGVPPATTTTTAAGATTTTTAAGVTTTTAAGATTTTGGGGTTTTGLARRPPNGSASVDNATPRQGETIRVVGGGFRAGSSVRAILFSTPVVLGTATAGPAGNVGFAVRIPSNVAPGMHELQLQGVNPQNQDRTLATTITVRAAQSTLGRTGDDVLWKLALALGLLALGVALVWSTRPGPGRHFSR